MRTFLFIGRVTTFGVVGSAFIVVLIALYNAHYDIAFLFSLVGILVGLPASIDPAIRLREWLNDDNPQQ